MLKSLLIKNYALIQSETIEFKDGLNIIMGETGAGKSMVISALEVVLGGRAATNMVRHGEKKAVIEATFSFPNNKAIAALLKENDLDDDLENIIVRREFLAKGGSRSFLCDTPANVSLLKEFGDLAADFHGQHEHQSLLDSSIHIDYLDKFAGSEPLLQKYQTEFFKLKDLVSKYRKLIENENRLKEKVEFDRLRLDEINKVAPKADESRQLEAELNVMQNVERINVLTSTINNELYGTEDSVYTRLHTAIDSIEELKRYNKEFEQFSTEIKTAMVSAKEVANFAKEYSRSVDFNPQLLEEKRQRANQLRNLEKKYGSIREILKLREKLETDVNQVDNLEFDKAELKKNISAAKELTAKEALNLSKFRATKAKDMEAQIKEKLIFLGIEHPQFLVDFSKETTKSNLSLNIDGENILATENGIDRVNLLISTNLGQTPKALQAVASGGEISRVMLSIKSLLAKNAEMPILVFDEIDTGISGRIARKTGVAMSRLSKDHQILAITHLPQIAALGDNNIIVEKVEENSETYSSARIISANEKIEEVAKLIGDGIITDASKKSAIELIN
ncbi:MAG: DNA repair protein RecN [Bacteroidetes bacterium 4572_77]|nr:MAG: DNA repair protein RecN [Bacteroidetes bacterium 4572_77]